MFIVVGLNGKNLEQRDQNDDGLFNRFLIAVAYKHRPLRETPNSNVQIPKVTHLFYLTKKLHANETIYSYHDDGRAFHMNKSSISFFS